VTRWLYHLVTADDDRGDPYTPASLAREGFIHCSYQPDVAETARLYFPAGIAPRVLQIDPRRLGAGAGVTLAEVPTPRGPMPHLHGPLPRSAVVATLPLEAVASAPDHLGRGMLPPMSDPESILAFWFGQPATTAEEQRKKIARWYGGDAELDREIAARFTEDVERAVAGELKDWEQAPRSRLALILLLDQLTRSLYRGTWRAFASDARALHLAIDGIERFRDHPWTLDERQFWLMPLLHAEDLAAQARGVALFPKLVDDAPAELRPFYAMGIEQSNKFHDVIARFGRFPHRNEALGRVSTDDELEFLEGWAARHPPAGAPTKA
jgi:uncharacterized protein (DUF924 family)/uncharacterized protein (DUF952 family)